MNAAQLQLILHVSKDTLKTANSQIQEIVDETRRAIDDDLDEDFLEFELFRETEILFKYVQENLQNAKELLC